MTAPARLKAARDTSATRRSEPAADHWRHAVKVRREWLGFGLDTAPADRVAAEAALTSIYARHGRSRPRFVWVDSPLRALPLLAGLPDHETLQRWVMARRPPGTPPLASDLAAGLSRLRSTLDECADHPALDPPRPSSRKGKPWPVLPPLEALDAGVPLREVLRQGVRAALATSLAEGCHLPVRAALIRYGPVPVAWYGQHGAHWVAHYDALRRLGLARYRPADEAHLDDWAVLARSCGWWWPGEDRCVVVERPATIRTRAAGGWHDEVRLDDRDGPPVTYRDGWQPALDLKRRRPTGPPPPN